MNAPSPRIRSVFAAAAILGVIIAAGSPAAGAPSPPKTGLLETNGTVRVGQAAPPVGGLTLNGARFDSAGLRGRPFLLDFSSIFCGSCQETIRDFKRLKEAYKKSDLELIVVVDGATPAQTIRNFFEKLGVSYTVIRDADGSLTAAYGVTTIPFQVAVDRAGIIRKIHQGFDPQIERTVDLPALVGGRSPAEGDRP
jgi:peroxiredoxin